MFGLSTLTTIPAVAFYAAILAVALSSRVRDWVERYLSMPRPSNQRHLASLDALRGLAALLVAAFHGWQWPGAPPHTVPAFIENGTKAVPVFVALSGFLIYRAVLAVESGAQLRRYLRNRFFRIFPLYAASVVALAALGCLGDSESKLTEFLANFFMLRAFGSPLFYYVIFEPAGKHVVDTLILSATALALLYILRDGGIRPALVLGALAGVSLNTRYVNVAFFFVPP